MTRGVITDIHRTSVVDGPGLRTTVFLKGCPLRCTWCHNPETQKRETEIAFDWSKADERDFELVGAPELVGSKLDLEARTLEVMERSRKVGINKCVEQSVSGAFSLYGREVSIEEVVAEVVKDRDYYENSGGGVTLSGGEPMAQSEFALALLKRLKEEDIHTVLDTTGLMSPKNLERSMEVTDLYLFDYKASSEETHKRLTGVSQKQILENLEELILAKADVIIRCPLIPGINDDEEHLQGIVALVQKYPGIRKVDILTWHTMGKGKYQRLGKNVPQELPEVNVSEEGKNHYRAFFERSGLNRVEVY